MTTRAEKRSARARRVAARRWFSQTPLRVVRHIYPRDRIGAGGVQRFTREQKIELGYGAATYSRDAAVTTASAGSEAANLRYDRVEMIKRSRQLWRDCAIYKGVVSRAVDFIVGRNGFQLQARTSSPRANTYLEMLWRKEFAPYPDVSGRLDILQLQRSICQQVLLDGDVGLLKLFTQYGGRVQVIDAMRIGGYDIYSAAGVDSGVKRDSFGRPTAYMLHDYDASGYLGSTGRPVPAANFIHVANFEFPNNVRGVIPLAPSFSTVAILDDILQSEAKAWQALSRFALAVERENASTIADALAAEDSKDLPDGSLTTKVQELEQAIIFNTDPGGKIRGVDRNLPGVQLEPATRLLIRLIGLPLGVPLELALLDWSKTNYSSARASLEVAYQNFSRWQALLKRQFFAKLYRWKVRDWVARGLVDARDDMYEHEWIAPEFPWIDQLKETQAWGERIDRGMATWGMAVRAAGQDPDELRAARAGEIQAAIEAAEKLNATYPGANVDWRTLVGLEPRSTGGPVPTVSDTGGGSDGSQEQN